LSSTETRIYDLGCSTGATLLELSRRMTASELEFVGIDNSSAMVDKAALKAEMFAKQGTIRFIHGDIAAVELEPCGPPISIRAGCSPLNRHLTA
jgi:tRNA (cmo5U34)-methyltransferase